MTQDAIRQSYRGVLCLSCRQPIPLPAVVANMESANQANASEVQNPKHNRVFSLRCRSCEREKPYRATDIIDFDGTPKPRASRARKAHASEENRRGLSRAANG
jgi:hypothetical protein